MGRISCVGVAVLVESMPQNLLAAVTGPDVIHSCTIFTGSTISCLRTLFVVNLIKYSFTYIYIYILYNSLNAYSVLK